MILIFIFLGLYDYNLKVKIFFKNIYINDMYVNN